MCRRNLMDLFDLRENNDTDIVRYLSCSQRTSGVVHKTEMVFKCRCLKQHRQISEQWSTLVSFLLDVHVIIGKVKAVATCNAPPPPPPCLKPAVLLQFLHWVDTVWYKSTTPWSDHGFLTVLPFYLWVLSLLLLLTFCKNIQRRTQLLKLFELSTAWPSS